MRAVRFIILIISLLLTSCIEDELLKGNLYTFKGETITQYVNHEKDLSMFARLLERSCNSNKSGTSVASLLGSRENYSAFIPTNKAVATYLDSIYGKDNYDIDTIPTEEANRIVLNCVMDFGDKKPTLAGSFWEGTVPESMLNDYNILIQYGNYGKGITTQINRNCYVTKENIELSNGLVHWVDRVIEPIPQSVPTLIKEVDSLSIFYHLLETTAWADSMVLFKDKKYVAPESNLSSVFLSPQYRMHGYTVFAETNEVFHEKWGVPLPQTNEKDGHVENWNEIMSVICQKCSQAYPDATSPDLTNTQNALNKFVAYHLVDGKFHYDILVTKTNEGKYNEYSKGFSLYPPIDSWRYYCTKGPERYLLKITHVVKNGTMRINRKSFYNNAFDGDYQETSCPIKGICISGDHAMYGTNYARNGYYYTLDDILLYTDEVKHGVLNERIRYDVTHYLPELSSGDFFHRGNTQEILSFPWNYFSNYVIEGSGRTTYYYPNTGYESDLLNSFSFTDNKSFTIKLMPVPFEGKWQVRIALSIIQNVKSYEDVYFGPSLNTNQMKKLELNPKIFNKETQIKRNTYKQDILFDNDSIACKENDKQLYLRHLMKGPKGIPIAQALQPVYYKTSEGKFKFDFGVKNITLRDYAQNCRIILYEGYMNPRLTYYIKLQHKKDLTELGLQRNYVKEVDYIELVPESVYNNPERTEDVW